MSRSPVDESVGESVRLAREARARYRAGAVEATAGIAPRMAQANLVAVPQAWAWDFLLFCQRNPKPCPVLDLVEAGEFRTALAEDADLRTDLPLYRVWRNGELREEIIDATRVWAEHPDLVTFLIGCSFTFEGALLEAGIEVRHISQGTNVAMYLTNRSCRPAGRVRGPLVVSMRPVAAGRVSDAARISGRYPSVHGAPVHCGDPGLLGIRDLERPDFGDPVRVDEGEVPVFWACGVTPQAAIMASGVPFAVTHAPGHMFITDIPDHTYHV